MGSKATRRIVLPLALAVVAFGLGLAWWAHRRQAHLKKVGDEIRAWGGEANRWANTNPAWDLVRKVLGRGLVDSIVGFEGYHLQGPMNGPGEPRQLAQLLEFQPIKSFDALNGNNLGDGWIERIRDASAVQSLGLSSTKITDRSSSKFKEMKNLRSLDLSCTRITDQSLANVILMKNLDRLSLVFTDMGDESIDEISRQLRLSRFEFGGKNIGAIRLLEVWASDSQGRRVYRADRVTRLRGRLAIDPRPGQSLTIEVMAYGSANGGGGRCRTGPLVNYAPGLCSFDVKADDFKAGRFNVWMTLKIKRPGRPIELTCRLPYVPMMLMGGGAGGDNPDVDR